MMITARPCRDRTPLGFDRLEARRMLNAPGTLDPTFASGRGVASYPLTFATVFASGPATGAMAVQPDGKIVVAVGGSVDGNPSTFQVLRFTAGGLLDTGFGTGGRVTVATQYAAAASAVAIQPDGMIVVAGSADVPSSASAGKVLVEDVVARLDPDGALDNTFGLGGSVSFPVGGLSDSGGNMTGVGLDQVKSVLIQPDGRIVVAGDAMNADSTGTDFAAARLTASGVLDGTFGMAGTVLVPVQVPNPRDPSVLVEDDRAAGAGLQSTGQIVIAGTAVVLPFEGGYGYPTYPIAVRLDANGTLDPTFGSTDLPGVAHPFATANFGAGSVSNAVYSMALQPDDSIVLGVNSSSAIRLDAAGAVDTTFGNAGEATLSASTGGSVLLKSYSSESVAIGPDGSIVLNLAGARDDRVGRLTSTGAPDPTFGVAATPGVGPGLGNGANIGGVLAIAAGGHYLLANSSAGYLTLAQVLANPTPTIPVGDQPTADFDGSGRSDLAVYLPAQGAFAYRPDNGGPDVIVPFGTPGAGATIPAPGDYDGVGHAEIAAYLPSLGAYAIRDTSTDTDRIIAFGSPGSGRSIPTPGDYLGNGVDDLAVYLPSLGAFAIRPSTGGPDRIIAFGQAGLGNSIPAPADYFGTGVDDIAVYLPSLGAFAIRDPSTGTDEILAFGSPWPGRSIPCPGDYDGSGRAELAVYLPNLGLLAYRPADGGPDRLIPFGTPASNSLPTPGDYTGAGRDEIAIYDQTLGYFAYRPTTGPDVIAAFGPGGVGQSLPVATPQGALPPFVATTGQASADAISDRVAPLVVAQAEPSTPGDALAGG